MNPLDRALRQRRQTMTRALVGAACLVIGSAGIVTPPLRDHQKASKQLQRELEASIDPLARGAEAIAFRAEGMSKLESAERHILMIAPREPLPSGFRAQLKERLERSGAQIISIEVRPQEPFRDTEAGEGEAEGPGNPLFLTTPIDVEFRVAYEQLANVIDSIAQHRRPGFITSLTVERVEENLMTLNVKLRAIYLHVVIEREPNKQLTEVQER